MKPVLLALLLAAPATAQDFSAGSNATSWNLYAEVPAAFSAKVVDLLCEVAGDCANQCAPGRQLGLLRDVDGQLVYPNKNSQPLFTGAAVELAPFCGKQVDVDGLLIEDADIGARNIYLVQLIRETGSADWVKANQWTKDWQARNPGATGKGEWFRRDPRVTAQIEAHGYLGNGLSHKEAYEATQ